MTQTVTRPESRRRGEATAAILQAAEELFSAQGFDAVSLRQVAERAGVSKANIIHHFGSKEGLYLAVLRGAVRQSDELLAELEAETGDPLERLRRYAGGHLRQMFEHPRLQRLILREVLEHGQERGRAIAGQVVGESFGRLVALVREGQRSGQLRDGFDPALMAVLLVASKVFLFQAHGVLRHLPGVGFADDPEAYMGQVMDLLLQGIRPGASA